MEISFTGICSLSGGADKGWQWKGIQGEKRKTGAGIRGGTSSMSNSILEVEKLVIKSEFLFFVSSAIKK